jgi:O-antigen/teichoic acid export membrane protein
MVRRNIIANTLGRGWSILMAIAFVPIYIKLLGIEAFGLIGFFVTLQGLFAILDLGLSTTLSRELARASVHPEQAQRTRDLVRTLEVIYWGIALLIGAAVIALAPWIANHWLNPQGLSQSAVQEAITLLGLVIAFQWPIGFYSGGLVGLQRQVLNNIITAGLATVRGIGAVAVLWFVAPTIDAYFKWQLAVSILGVASVALALWGNLPKGDRPARFERSLLQSVWRFAGGMTAISAVVLLLVQTDKVLLSRLLSLEMFGYYMLAAAVAGASVFFVGPIFTAVFPRFTQLVATGDQERLRDVYHQACQLVSVAVIPLMLVVAFFSLELLTIWTGNQVIAERAYWLVSLLAIGSALNGLMHVPYAAQLAHGWTGLALTANVIAVIVLVPLIIVLTIHYGAVGAASAWVLLNTGYVLLCIPATHRRILRGEMGRWYKLDVGRPLAAALPVVVLARWFYPDGMTPATALLYLAAIGGSAVLAATVAGPDVRRLALSYLTSLANGRSAKHLSTSA